MTLHNLLHKSFNGIKLSNRTIVSEPYDYCSGVRFLFLDDTVKGPLFSSIKTHLPFYLISRKGTIELQNKSRLFVTND